METIVIILGFLKFSLTPMLKSILIYIFKNIFKFKYNIEFHKILESFPLISEDRINKGIKSSIGDYNDMKISKDFTEFCEKHIIKNLDEFLAKLEKFDVSKVKHKKEKITSFINEIKNALVSGSANISIESTFNSKTKEITHKTTGKPYEWSAFNYMLVNKIIKDQKRIDGLYVCKRLNF